MQSKMQNFTESFITYFKFWLNHYLRATGMKIRIEVWCDSHPFTKNLSDMGLSKSTAKSKFSYRKSLEVFFQSDRTADFRFSLSQLFSLVYLFADYQID